MAAIDFQHAGIAVDGTTILRDVSLSVADGEFVGVIGPSGSGKTTLLRAVAGFSEIVSGTVRFDGADMATVGVDRRDVAMVFQTPVLFAHRSVERNVSFPLELRRQHIDEIRRRVGAEVRALHLEHLLERPSGTLSRGEAQLVQIARAMVRLPNVLLLDEPLATLDDSTRRRMQGELSLLQDGYGVTTMMATNDADDAMRMATRLVVLGAGRVVQVGTPAEVRRSPATFDAAVSTGECWQIRARVEAGQEGFWLVRDGRPVGTSSAGTSFRHRAWAPALADRVGEEVIVGLRPHDVAVAADGPVPAMVTRVIPGQSTTLVCDVAGCPVGVHTDVRAAVGDAIRLRIDRLTVFDASSGFAIV